MAGDAVDATLLVVAVLLGLPAIAGLIEMLVTEERRYQAAYEEVVRMATWRCSQGHRVGYVHFVCPYCDRWSQ